MKGLPLNYCILKLSKFYTLMTFFLYFWKNCDSSELSTAHIDDREWEKSQCPWYSHAKAVLFSTLFAKTSVFYINFFILIIYFFIHSPCVRNYYARRCHTLYVYIYPSRKPSFFFSFNAYKTNIFHQDFSINSLP